MRERKSRLEAASACIGEIEDGQQIFAVTEGQFSLIDAVDHLLSLAGPSSVEFFVWSFGQHDLGLVEKWHSEGRIVRARVLIDRSFMSTRLTGRDYARAALPRWRDVFGPESVRISINHAKIVLVRSETHAFTVRSSMNPNLNSRFENLDIARSVGMHDAHLRIFDDHPILPEDASGAEIYRAAKVGGKPNMAALIPAFKNLRKFKK